jgi:hypothetical protein
MKNNVFELDDTTWLQKTGTAMGTSVACVYATIYYSQHEELSILTDEHNAFGINFYRRFIDDALILQRSGEHPERYQQLRTTMNSFGELGRRLEWTSDPPSKTVNFLDLTIHIGNDGRITTKTFQKAMNLFLYIPPISSHPKSVITSLIFGQLRRFWLQNSLRDDYVQCASAFFNHLIARGHDDLTLQELFRLSAARLDKTLTPKSAIRPELTRDAPVFLHMEFHPQQLDRLTVQNLYRGICSTPFHATVNTENQRTGIGRLTIALSRPKNLRDRLCRTKMVQPENDHVSDYIDRLRFPLTTVPE